jgi:hypothetical protein
MKAVIITALLLAGCVPEGAAVDRLSADQEPAKVGRVKNYNMPGLAIIREFWLEDGTHCVYAYGIGITCDWRDKNADRN